MMKCYVVTAPPSARGIYDTWPACEAAEELKRLVVVADHERDQGQRLLNTCATQEALQIIRDQPVHLLVMDVVLPLMRGTELADRAQAIRASIKVLLVSGYTISDIGPSGRPFLAKPFSIET